MPYAICSLLSEVEREKHQDTDKQRGSQAQRNFKQMNLPSGFFIRAVKLTPEYEPDDFSLFVSDLSLPILSSWERLQLIARGLRAICLIQPHWPPRTPQMDSILGVHWNDPSCPLPMPTEKASSPLMLPPLMPLGFNSAKRHFPQQWTDGQTRASHGFFSLVDDMPNRQGYNKCCISLLNICRKYTQDLFPYCAQALQIFVCLTLLVIYGH